MRSKLLCAALLCLALPAAAILTRPDRDIGDWELYARVSEFAEWIDATMARVAEESRAAAARDAAAAVGDAERR